VADSVTVMTRLGPLLLAILPLGTPRPIARHMVVEITPATDKLIELDAFVSGVHNCTIKTLPAVGSLYQLSDNYMNYKYTPWKGLTIAADDVVRVETNCTIVYEAPLDFSATRFTYTVNNGSGGLSSTGIVDLLKADRIMQYSNFTFNDESWKVITAVTKDVCWSSTAITGNLNHYIYNCNMEKTLMQDNTARWYFKAPAGFHRNLANVFNGTVEFDLAGFEGYFTEEKLYETPSTFIYLGCSTCNSGEGLYIAQRNVTFDGSAMHFKFRLNDNPYNGWRRDPFDIELSEWPLTTNCEIVEVLSGLDVIHIFADVSESEEIVGIDDFVFTGGPSSTYIPNTCYSDVDVAP